MLSKPLTRAGPSLLNHLNRAPKNPKLISVFALATQTTNSRVSNPNFSAMRDGPSDKTHNRASSAVLYHYPCPDGAFAALAAHLYFSVIAQPVLFFPNTVYHPLKVDDLPLWDLKEVYLLDFVGPAGFVEQISSRVERVIILDHHKTALEMFGRKNFTADNVTWVIDIQRSGATIAYDYFKEKLAEKNIESEMLQNHEVGKVTQLFKYIEDADIWRWKLPKSKAFSSGLKDLNIEFDVRSNPVLFEQLLALDSESVINQGMESLSQKQKLISEVLEQSFEIALGNGIFGRCLAVEADSISELRSELGHQLANKSHSLNLRSIGAIVYRVPELENNEMLKISLRSVFADDTTPISLKFGGGGHRNASSFMISSAEFEQWKV